jgi:hypothetical protein
MTDFSEMQQTRRAKILAQLAVLAVAGFGFFDIALALDTLARL